ncbi:MAG: xanthine dehydrogenase family protein subunit M [Deltaproteobacteria bacterium]|nr:xanthine dehydrogenase family protein subunit M [Deltaproteobacteria bacterium]
MRPVFLPRTLDELWEIRSKNPGAVVYAGGTDLLVRIRKGLAFPSSLVCLERIRDLKGLREDGDRVFIGACSTHSSLLADPLLRTHFPVLGKALRILGSPLVRNMGTIGGNIVTASPAGDTLPALYVLGAHLEIMRRDSSRQVPVEDFIHGPGRTELSEGEIVAGVWLRKKPTYSVNRFEKVGQRKALAIAVVSLAALLQISEKGLIQEARLAWGSVGPTVVTSETVESSLVGRPLNVGTLKEAALLAREAVSPIDDVRATASYRRLVAGNLLFRLLGDLPDADTTTTPGDF